MTQPPTAPSNEKVAPKQQKTGLAGKLVAGAIAGITGTCVIYPLDIIKTNLQNGKVKSTAECVKQIWTQNGVRGFYKGITANLIGITPEKAIKLAVNDYTREYLAARSNVSPDHLPILQGMFAGGFAGFCQVIATNPMEITKINIQMRKGHVSPIQMARELGLKGLYRGTPATLMRDIPFSFIFFPTSAVLKEKAAAANNGVLTFNGIFWSGIAAGVLAAGSVTPADVIKTRLQTIGGTKYNGIADCFVRIVREEGVLALYKGALQRCMIISPLFGITLLVCSVSSPNHDRFTKSNSASLPQSNPTYKYMDNIFSAPAAAFWNLTDYLFEGSDSEDDSAVQYQPQKGSSNSHDWVNHMLRILLKSIDSREKFNQLLKKKTQNTKISDLELRSFEIHSYPVVSDISDYRPAAVGKGDTTESPDGMHLEFKLSNVQIQAKIECKFYGVPVKLTVNLKNLRGEVMMRLKPNNLKLRFKGKPDFKIQIIPVLYDVQINLSLLKHTLKTSIKTVVENEFVQAWFQMKFLTTPLK